MRDECKESSMGERSMVSLTLSKKEMGFHWVRFMPDRTCSFLFLLYKVPHLRCTLNEKDCGSVNVKTASPLDNVISLN